MTDNQHPATVAEVQEQARRLTELAGAVQNVLQVVGGHELQIDGLRKLVEALADGGDRDALRILGHTDRLDRLTERADITDAAFASILPRLDAHAELLARLLERVEWQANAVADVHDSVERRVARLEREHDRLVTVVEMQRCKLEQRPDLPPNVAAVVDELEKARAENERLKGWIRGLDRGLCDASIEKQTADEIASWLEDRGGSATSIAAEIRAFVWKEEP